MNQIARRSLIQCLYNQSKLLVGIFLSRPRCQQRAKFLEAGSQCRSLLAIPLAFYKALAEGFFG